MEERKMTLEELVGWLSDNDVSCEIDNVGRLTVKGSLQGHFRDWVGACKYTGLPDKLICVNGDLWLEYTPIVSLGGLTSAEGSLDLIGTPITSLGNLTSVGGWLYLHDTPLTSLGNLTSVGESLDLTETPITSLGNLTSVGGSLDLTEAPITSLDNLTSIGGFLNLRNTPLASLGNLTSVVRGLDLQGTPLTSLDNLPRVGRDLHLDQNQFQLITREALQKVKGKVKYRDQATEKWVTLSPDELEAIVTENERRERLHSVRESDVDWDLYDR